MRKELGIFVIAINLAFVLSLGIASIRIAELPKLESRVDELTTNLEARDEDMVRKNEAHQKIVEAKDKEVKALTERVKVLEKALRVKDIKIKELTEETQKVVSRGGNFREVSTFGSDFEITWYNDYNYTKSGRFVTKDVTIAVDPRVIPLDTWVKIEFPDGREYIRRADDTGRAVKGNIIDIYDNASDTVLFERGRTHGVKVTVLRKL